MKLPKTTFSPFTGFLRGSAHPRRIPGGEVLRSCRIPHVSYTHPQRIPYASSELSLWGIEDCSYYCGWYIGYEDKKGRKHRGNLGKSGGGKSCEVDTVTMAVLPDTFTQQVYNLWIY